MVSQRKLKFKHIFILFAFLVVPYNILNIACFSSFFKSNFSKVYVIGNKLYFSLGNDHSGYLEQKCIASRCSEVEQRLLVETL